MFTYSQILIILAVLPGLFLAWKIYQLDKIEKEPFKLLAKLFFGGALSIISAIILELIGQLILGFVFAGAIDEYGYFTSDALFYVYNFFMYFCVVACAEEFGKFFVLKKLTWTSPEFDYRFDAVVYAVCVGIGFAVFENIEYAFMNGIATTLLRAVTAIPAHTIFAIFMGNYYGRAKECSVAGDAEGEKKYMKMAFWVPVALHGFYDFAASGASVIFAIIFFVFVIALDIITYKQVKAFSAADEALYKPEDSDDSDNSENVEEMSFEDPKVEDLVNKYSDDNNDDSNNQ